MALGEYVSVSSQRDGGLLACSRPRPGAGPIAGAVAYSGVRTGVHHRADVVAGSAIGVAIRLAAATARSARRPRRPTLFTQAVLVTSPRIPRSRDYAAARREMRRLGVAEHDAFTAHAEAERARRGRAPRLAAVLRNVLGGAVAMGVTYGIGSLVGASGL